MTLSSRVSSLVQQVLGDLSISGVRSKGLGNRKTRSISRFRRSFEDRQVEQLEQLELRTLLSVVNEGQPWSLTMTAPSLPAGATNLQWSNFSSSLADCNLAFTGMSDFGSFSAAGSVFSLQTFQDNIDEYDESYSITVTATLTFMMQMGPYGSPMTSQMQVTKTDTGMIIDDDAAPVVRLQRLDASGNLKSNNTVQESGYLEPARFRVIASHPSVNRE